VIGQEEVDESSINIRTRSGKPIGKQTTAEFIQLMIDEYPEGVPKP
jgi:threonyl-tRNA synthetase